MFRSAVISGYLLIVGGALCWGDEGLRVGGIFGDHMVLQRDGEVVVWGSGVAGAGVGVEFDGRVVAGEIGGDGKWEVVLPAMTGSVVGRDFVVRSGAEVRVFKDVVVGDVWHASGQSNMGMTLKSVAGRLEQGEMDLAAAALPGIRFRRSGAGAAERALGDLPGGAWSVCSPGSAGGFSAAAFYFARRVHAEVGVPVGVIDTSRGGTPIEPFIPRGAFVGHPVLEKEGMLGDAGDLEGIFLMEGGVRARDANWLPGRLFNSRVAPLARFRVRGMIWYQAESNCGVMEDPRHYAVKMRALINGWRDGLGDAGLPVYYVQLPGGGAGAGWPYMREQQRLVARDPRVGMAVTIDLLDSDIHPANKIDVGERLARWALVEEYAKGGVAAGPLFRESEFGDGMVVVRFDHVGSGLMVGRKEGLAVVKEVPGLELSLFEVADSEGTWHAAEAVVQGDVVEVRCAGVAKPAAVRYGYAVSPTTCHLYNREGLPAAPFCSDVGLLDYDPGLAAE